MSTKHDSVCLRNAGDDEPIFVLRAQDIFSVEVVEYWALQFRKRHYRPVLHRDRYTTMEWDSEESRKKFESALACVQAMREWPSRKVPD